MRFVAKIKSRVHNAGAKGGEMLAPKVASFSDPVLAISVYN